MNSDNSVMGVMKISWLSGFVLFGMLCGCRQQVQEQEYPQEQGDTSNRIYFAFDGSLHLLIPTQLNDSVTVKLAFDTGDGWGYYNESINLDTSVLSSNPSLSRNHVWAIRPWGSAWVEKRMQATYYDSMQLKLKIGHTDIVYSGICSVPYKKYMNRHVSDGLFNIPKSDTTHVWELNFENNYMEVHPAENYTLPKDCIILPLEDGRNGPFYITFPLRLCFSDKDTLTIHRKFFIDTGAHYEIVLLPGAPEQDYLHQRENAVWLQYAGHYVRYYTATATLFDDLRLDSLRIYTLDYKTQIRHPYFIGLNFLRRFNCFFDMKNRRLGLQPLRNYQRWETPILCRFHYSTRRGKDGRSFVDSVAGYKGNFFKTAGLQVGDEIVAIEGFPYGEVTWWGETLEQLHLLDTWAVDIVRDGKPQTLYVKIDHNEPMGD